MKARIKLKIFSIVGLDYFLPGENDVNEWIEREGLNPADIMKVCQSESSSERGNSLTISVWYIPTQSEREWITENLPETNPPTSTRPGAEYGVDV